MRTTIDLPDLLLKRAKARAAMRGVTLRTLFTEALEDYLSSDRVEKAAPDIPREVPVVRADDLVDYADAQDLRRAYTRGYRISGTLLSAGGGSSVNAGQVAEVERSMEEEEMNADACAG